MKQFMTALVIVGLFFAGSLCAKEAGGAKEHEKGVLVGKIVKKDGSKITVEGDGGSLTLMPYWRGGMPKDGGGFDKDMVAKLKKFEKGDRVKVEWTFEEHHRIDSIQKLEGDGEREKPRKE